jgi:hypothetical protein
MGEDSCQVSTPKINQPCVFELKEKGENQVHLKKYNSLIDYERFHLRHQNISKLKGCFERDNVIG